ncbi:sensor histidine kinase [Nonomuraea aridisoli]|uniref:histidine kinase n=1 Tax=Nonomuraea aridisoli TaxID=2070368 RepID=A0A2W2F1X4_9ACTN|nr:histidine kinase [Nonomuraea aridisoli]PZG19770.1 sensor histidine kinase [Nonomuraea aridisoli]
MGQVASIRDISSWLRFSGDRPPMVFTVFWGAAALCTATLAHGLAMSGSEPGWELYPVLLAGGAVALPVAAVLWHVLPWRAPASLPRGTASVAFLVLTLLLLPAGAVPALLLVTLAVGNAQVVFGRRGALAYAAISGLYAFSIAMLNPTRQLLTAVADGAIMVLLCLLILVVVVAAVESHGRAEETRRVLAELEEAHAELERYAARSRELAVAEERARLARDMHDSVGHYLTVINVGLQNAQRYRTIRPDDAWDEVRQAQALTLEALTDTRRWVRALKPLRMDGRAGVAGLRALAESFGSADAGVVFTVTGAWPQVDEARELVCYRVVQEGLTNALRHARARRIEVALDCTPERVRVTVCDDGEGAPPGALGGGSGLRGLRERLAAVDGVLDVVPAPGFTLRATVPV